MVAIRTLCLGLWVANLAVAQEPVNLHKLVDLLPRDTTGFVRIKTETLWRKGALEFLDERKIDGDESLFDALSEETHPQKLSNLKEVLLATWLTDTMPEEFKAFRGNEGFEGPYELLAALVTTKQPVNPAEHLKQLQEKVDRIAKESFGEAEKLTRRTAGGQTFFATSQHGAYFPNSRQYVAGSPDAIKTILEGMAKSAPPVATEWQLLAASEEEIVGLYRLPQDIAEELNEALPGGRKLPKTVQGEFKLTWRPQLAVNATVRMSEAADPITLWMAAMYLMEIDSGQSNETGESGDSIQLFKEELLDDIRQEMVDAAVAPAALLKFVNAAIEAVPAGRLSFAKNELRYQATVPVDLRESTLAATEGLAAFIQGIGDAIGGAIGNLFGGPAAERNHVAEELKRIGVGIEAYQKQHHGLPPIAIVSKDGVPLLSWRVALLPYIGEKKLYDQFKLDEPWDSRHNWKVVKDNARRNVYLSNESGVTHLRVVSGGNAPFRPADNGEPTRAFVGDRAATALVVEAKRSVVWTQPESLRMRKGYPLPTLGEHDPTVDVSSEMPWAKRAYYALMADGRVRFVHVDMNDADTLPALRAMLTADGSSKSPPLGNVVPVELKPRPLLIPPPMPIGPGGGAAPAPPAPVNDPSA